MPNYLTILATCFPGAEAYTGGDPTAYNDLIWVTTPIAQAVLDASDCAAGTPIDIGAGTLSEVYEAGAGLGFWYGVIPFQAGTTQYASSLVEPPITEGSEIWNTTLTPRSDSSMYTISFALQLDCSKAANIMAAVYANSTLVGASMRYASGSDKPGNMHIQYTYKPPTPDPVTFTARIGLVESNGTWYINRTKTYTAGDSLQQHFVILENG